MNPLFAFLEGALAPSHIILVLAIGVLLFGKRLPEIGRALGKTLVEFKKGVQGMKDDLGTTVSPPAAARVIPPQRLGGDRNVNI